MPSWIATLYSNPMWMMVRIISQLKFYFISFWLHKFNFIIMNFEVYVCHSSLTLTPGAHQRSMHLANHSPSHTVNKTPAKAKNKPRTLMYADLQLCITSGPDHSATVQSVPSVEPLCDPQWSFPMLWSTTARRSPRKPNTPEQLAFSVHSVERFYLKALGQGLRSNFRERRPA